MADDRTTAIGPTDAGHFGVAGAGVVIGRATIAAAWNVQGDPARAGFLAAAADTFGVDLPTTPNTTTRSDALTVFWLGPRSWLMVAGGASPLIDFAAKRGVIGVAGGAVFDVSASRIAWTIEGRHAADVLAKGCPLDFHPRAFPPGSCAQSLYGHVNVLIERRADPPAFVLYAWRSYAADVWHALASAAAQYGCDTRSPSALR